MMPANNYRYSAAHWRVPTVRHLNTARLVQRLQYLLFAGCFRHQRRFLRSPVIDINGNVIALNAGARADASSSYFLPLGPAVRALRLIIEGQPVTRGTLQTVFDFHYYDELERLGLTAAEETRLRRQNPRAGGLLVVNQVQPGGPADGILQAGDILLSVNGQNITSFMPLEEILDDSIGKSVSLDLIRGGQPVNVRIRFRTCTA